MRLANTSRASLTAIRNLHISSNRAAATPALLARHTEQLAVRQRRTGASTIHATPSISQDLKNSHVRMQDASQSKQCLLSL